MSLNEIIAASPDEDEPEGPAPPVVGVGASAGGLEALQTLVGRIPPDSGASYVVVQHLSPDHASIMDQLLGARTTLPVVTIEDGATLAPDTVYVTPAGHEVTIEGATLRLHERVASNARQAPIDRFFLSLAEARGRDAYCVVLSGTGTDGTDGLKAVKAAGGFAIVQESADAQFPGMPDSAAATGLVDFVLRAEDIPARLDEIMDHRSRLDVEHERAALHAEIEARLPELTALLGRSTQHDFSGYKPGTLVRRIERRMSLLRLRAVDSFLARIEDDEEEAQRLLQDFMIGVTRFFRDPGAFAALREAAVEPLVAAGADGIRAWTPGCSTGEETYTVAMLFFEAMREAGARVPLQVFGTDIDLAALGQARGGLYRPSAVEGVPADLRERYFRQEEKGWRAVPLLRETCVFAPHNLIQDPPYSRLDLITCRNLLIYMSNELQRRVIPRFHFALNPGGALLLGPAEGLAGEDGLFDLVDKRARVFRRNDEAPVHYTPLTDRNPRERRRLAPPAAWAIDRPPQPGAAHDPSREKQAEHAYLARHAKPFALVTGAGDVAYLSEAMTGFVRPARGEPSARIDAFLARELRVPVRGAIAEAAATGAEASVADVAVPGEGRGLLFDVTVSPMREAGDLFLLVLHPVRFRDRAAADASVKARRSEDWFVMERELASTHEQMRRLQDEHEHSTQEANASHEELLSMNEELQSSNEELETSREELQSINEELETVNAELSENNRQLVRANSDLKNLFESTDLATLFLDPALSVRSFTPATTRLFGIRSRDVGRPIRDLSSRVDYPELEADAERVLRTLEVVEREVTVAATDETFILRMRPYRTTDDRPDGFVLAFYDITERKRHERQLARNEHQLARQYGELETLYDTTPVGLSLVDRELRWLRINRRLAEINGFPVEAHIGLRQDELIPDIDGKIAEIQRRVFETGEAVGGIRVEGYTPKDPDRLRHWVVDYYPVFSDGEVFACGTCVREVTEEYALVADLAESEARLRQTVTRNPIHLVQMDAAGGIVWAQGGLPGLPERGVDDAPASLDPDLARLVAEHVGELRAGGAPRVFDATLPLERGARTYQVNLDRFGTERGGEGCTLIFTDVTERRSLEDRQAILLGELQHRVKNTLATIAAISRFLVRGARTPADYQKRLDERLRAISRSHDLLTAADWRGSSLRDIVEAEAAAYADGSGDRIRVGAQDVTVAPREAVSMGMAIHELMTNAAKHGALGAQDGWVEIGLEEGRGPGGRRRLVWKERGGPPVAPPEGGGGFGTFLIEKVLAVDLQGEARIAFEPDGVRCTIELPVRGEAAA